MSNDPAMNQAAVPAAPVTPAPAKPAKAKRPRKKHYNLRIFFIVFVVVALAGAFFILDRGLPSLVYNGYQKAILTEINGTVGVNTFVYQDQLARPGSGQPKILVTGTDDDVLNFGAWLDLGKGPLVMNVPDTADRYYVVQFIDPATGTNFGYVGRRTTGTGAGKFLITGPGWSGTIPAGMKQISSPDNTAFAMGRILVTSESDVQTAYNLATQITLASYTP